MKKLFALILSVVLILPTTGCKPETYYKLGETVSTDLFEFTLDDAQYAIALSNVNDENILTPKEFDSEKDKNNPFVAPTGYTYVYYSFTLKNISRSNATFGTDNGFETDYIFAKIDGKEYGNEDYSDWRKCVHRVYEPEIVIDDEGKMETKEPYKWYDGSWLGEHKTGYKLSLRSCLEIPVVVNDLTENVEIIIEIPNSQGDCETFKYLASSETAIKVEPSLEEAVAGFTQKIGQTYFKEHLSEYTSLSGDEIAALINKKTTWNIQMMLSYGHWEGKFNFQSDNRIKETLYDGSTGYFNNRTWKINENTLIIDDEYTCTVCKIDENNYLLIANNEPVILMN